MKEVIFAGFGGQGVLTGGMILTYMATEKDLEATWMPAYGPSMRGGKANCVVKMGDKPGDRIGNPLMSRADILVAMNEPSLDYMEKTRQGAIVIVNSQSVPPDYNYPADKKVYKVDCAGLAANAKNKRGQNLVMLGAVIKLSGLFEREDAERMMCGYFASKGKGEYNSANKLAFSLGYDAV